MNMLLLLPLGLAALASLLLPLLVHLARRSEQRVAPFAALRWLRAAPQPRRRHRFEELPLLLLRLLLLAVLALLLAQPVLFGRPDRRPWVAVAPGVDPEAARALAGEAEARWQLLAPGFPAVDPDGPAQAIPGAGAAVALPSLLRQLDAELPRGVALTVVVPATLEDADAQRPVLSREVSWRVLPSRAGDARTAVAPRSPPEPPLYVRHAPDRAASLRYLRAAGAAWAHETDARPGTAASPAPAVRMAPRSRPVPADARRLAWLAPGPVPDGVRAWVAKGGTVLLDADARWPGFRNDAPVAWHGADGTLARAIPVGRGRAIRLERPLLPATMPLLLEPDFPRQLRDLFDDGPVAPARVEAAGYAPLSGAAPYPERPRPLSPWLALLVAALFLLERWWASGPRRGGAA